MRNGYNQDLGRKIIAHKEQCELKVRYDVHGNVIRDYKEEIRLMAEDEQKNVLPELPIIIFDGCRKFSEHIKTEKNILPIVRKVKLAPLGETKSESVASKSLHFLILFLILKIPSLRKFVTKNNLRKIAIKNKKLPIYNRLDCGRSAKDWAMENSILKQKGTNIFDYFFR